MVTLSGPALSNVTAVAVGQSYGELFSLALKQDGTVVGWGESAIGGINKPGEMNMPGGRSVPPSLSNVTAIAAGAYQGLALKKDGTIVTWGEGNPSPKGLSNIVAVAAGGESGRNLALKSDGTVADWAVRSVEYESTVPSGLSNVVAVAAGLGHSLALKRDGTVVGWGSNRYGESTGIPTTEFPHESSGTVVIKEQVLTNVIAIAAGSEYSLALRSNGTVIAWGDNSFHQRDVPAGLSNVVAIAAGYNFCLAITTNSPVADRFRQK